jgi:alpha-1,6-mannosyltransferase
MINLIRITNFWWFVAVVVSAFGYYWIGYQVERTNFVELTFTCLILFLAFLVLIKVPKTIFNWLWIALIFRLIFLVAEPSLSDDYYRFIWDGRMWHAGENAYAIIPSNAPETTRLQIDSEEELLKGMNSPDYYSVYPPLHQAVFWLSAFGKSTIQSIVIIRILVIAFDIALIFMLIAVLKSMKLPSWHAAIYALNPLVIIESTGNLHLEIIMMFFFLAGVWLMMHQKVKLSAASIALSFLLKMTSAIYFPLLLLRLKLRGRFWWTGIIAIVVLSSLALLFSVHDLSNMSQSLDLYFRRFEFNASIYYVIRELGFWIAGYNVIQIIGPLLSVVSAGIILYLSFSVKLHHWQSMFITMCKIGLVFLLFSTTVHPWYIIPLLVLMIPAGVIFPLVWSFLILLSYSAYNSAEYHENFILIALEYFLLITAIFFELKWPEKVRAIIFSTSGENP